MMPTSNIYHYFPLIVAQNYENYTSDDERHENEYSNEMNTAMKLNGGIKMNTGMKLNVALMEMKAQINV